MESYKIKADYRIQKTRIVYEIEIAIQREFANRKRFIIRGDDAEYDISIMKKSCFCGYYFIFTIPEINVSCSIFPKDISYLQNFLSKYIADEIACCTLATAILDICKKW